MFLGICLTGVSIGLMATYSPTMPDLLRGRMVDFLASMAAGAVLFYLSFCASFFSSPGPRAARLSFFLFAAGIFSVGFALLTLVGFRITLVGPTAEQSRTRTT